MKIKTSVRKLIEFVLRSGDIDSRFYDNARAMQGIKAHQKIQNSYKGEFKKEYYLKNTTIVDDMEFIVDGRADGVLINDSVTIDEIKSTQRDLETIEDKKIHWAQVMCYGYFYCIQNNLKKIFVQLTYINVESFETKIFKKEMDFELLKDFYISLLKDYIEFSKIIALNLKNRNESCKNLDFPYEGYRKGQRKMAVAVFTTIREKKKLFVDAPTGIGKTVSTIFPSLKTFSEKISDKIFYLTAKNTNSNEAVKSLLLMKKNGLYIRALTIISKEKICINDEIKCNPIDCKYAKGHFDRVNDALKDILKNEDIIEYNKIIEYSKKYEVCPLEFELDIALYSDIIICDYNYIFDPNVYLKRFFEDINERYIFLIDEAHNLFQRTNKMYTQSIDYKRFKEIYEKSSGNKNINLQLQSVIDEFEKLYEETGKKKFYHTEKYLDNFENMLLGLKNSLEKFLSNQKDYKYYDEILEFYFEITRFLRVCDYFSEGFFSTLIEENENLIFEIKCVNPWKVLKSKYSFAISVIFFSATLSPMNYYMNVLAGEDAYKLHLDLPFSSKNFLILNDKISTRYSDRTKNAKKIAVRINIFINTKKGNYFIYFPSFEYMEEIFEIYQKNYSTENIMLQERYMDENKRYEFLQKFTYESSNVGFLILGGIFSEGIDLKGERLIGSMIISVGMPKVSYESQITKEYYDKKYSNGFEYAYTYPGINKVFQAAGRVIRSENDKGIIFLLDDRFSQLKYKRMYPMHWKKIYEVKNEKEIKKIIKEFWEKK
ncbi:MAG: ATP-dependent DNA helicase [Peptoniphilaceae bacterium]|nr:ATP-dependent DNA helicase [Peptoniphilaceae bacterium]MDD7383224.1 ATP-dependent DNA helicase [Peptoniphilaceae bacterium]MDY3738448.1 ATP-dependent DNA helicase [Peptoniphilaceae bacterium]